MLYSLYISVHFSDSKGISVNDKHTQTLILVRETAPLHCSPGPPLSGVSEINTRKRLLGLTLELPSIGSRESLAGQRETVCFRETGQGELQRAIAH